MLNQHFEALLWYKLAVNVGDREDLDLHRRLAQGDKDAFEALYQRYSGPAFALALRLTGQTILAQDIVHDAFLAAWRTPEVFDGSRGSFRTFFLSMVHHRSVDVIRREERLRSRHDRASNLEPLSGVDIAEELVEDWFIQGERKAVRSALQGLSENQRQVLELSYFGGMTQVQVSEHLGIPLGTVKTRTLAAMKNLRAVLQEDEDDPATPSHRGTDGRLRRGLPLRRGRQRG